MVQNGPKMTSPNEPDGSKMESKWFRWPNMAKKGPLEGTRAHTERKRNHKGGPRSEKVTLSEVKKRSKSIKKRV